MKFSKTMMAVMGALALTVVGCKYDEAAEGSDAAADEALANSGKNVQGQDIETVGGAVVDEDGTAATELPFDKDPNYTRCTDVEFEPVYFGFDASNLAPSELAKIEAVAQHLKDNADRVVIVEGNCDERGCYEYNLSLGDIRAISIRDYMATLGIAGARMQTKSYGEEKPAVSGSGAEDNMANMVRDLADEDMGGPLLPELSLSGKIESQKKKISSYKQRIEYIFQLSITDVKTGLAFWEGEKEIVKIGKR